MENRLLIVALCMCFILSNTACGKAKESKTENNETSTEPTEKTEGSTAPLMVDRLSEDAVTNTISDEMKEKAKAMPAVSYQALPDWNGTSLVNKMEYGWPVVKPQYTEALVKDVANEGFNFVRVPLDTRIFYTSMSGEPGEYFNGDSTQVNTKELKNVDELISWCIDNGIHVCFDVHTTPGGYMIGGDEEASRELLFTEGSLEEQYFFDFWEFFSQRYADISPNALSFNLYNEPPEFLGEEQYVRFIKNTLKVTTPANPDRVIFVDMLKYATEPVYGLEDEHIVQTFHCYEPYYFTNSGFDNMDYEAGEENRRSEHREKITYPLPAIYAGIHKGYKVSGDFKSGTKLKMAISGCQADVTINVKDSAGNTFYSKTFDKEMINAEGHEVLEPNHFYSAYEDKTGNLIYLECELDHDTTGISLSLSDNSAWMDMDTLTIETEDYKTKLVSQWIEGVLDELPGTDISIDERGIVTVNNPEAAKYNVGKSMFEERFQRYVDFSKETGIQVMMQEFGDTVYTDINCAKQYYEDVLSTCDELGINWVHWTFEGGDFSYAAPEEQYKRHDAKYEAISDGREVCKDLRDVFQKHM